MHQADAVHHAVDDAVRHHLVDDRPRTRMNGRSGSQLHDDRVLAETP